MVDRTSEVPIEVNECRENKDQWPRDELAHDFLTVSAVASLLSMNAR